MLAIVLEVQRDEDPDKKFSWPVYLTVVRSRKRCGAVVLVVAPNADVAAWSAENIDLGLGFGNVRPLVLGPAVVPVITDPTEAEKATELSVLSAVAHGNGPNGLAVVEAALVALGRLDREHAAVYFQSIWSGLREPMRQALEVVIMERQSEGEATFPRSFKSSSIAAGSRASSRASARASSRASVRASSRASARVSSKAFVRAREIRSYGFSRVPGSRSPRMRARASRHAWISRPSTTGSITSSGRSLPRKCSPDDWRTRPMALRRLEPPLHALVPEQHLGSSWAAVELVSMVAGDHEELVDHAVAGQTLRGGADRG